LTPYLLHAVLLINMTLAYTKIQSFQPSLAISWHRKRLEKYIHLILQEKNFYS